MEYITGEKIQEIADVSIAVNINGNYDSELVQTQLKNIKTKCYVFPDKPFVYDLPEEIKQAKKIFVYSHILKYFFDNIFPKLIVPFTLISHNGDDGITPDMLQYLDSPKLKRWYCQNRYIKHEKIFSLPIGIGNSQWPHGNITLLKQIRESVINKTNLVYKNFSIDTNSSKRKYCDTVTCTNGIYMSPPCNIVDNWMLTANSIYSIAPHGNGIDSHRIWECLYLNTIPIVEYHECFSQFTDLPILFVDDYAAITYNYLESEKQRFNNKNITKLDLNYWQKMINTSL
jgi:hypothetical protein